MLIYLPLLLSAYAVSAMSPFFEQGKRAEFFEMTDDVIPTFRITIPDDEYDRLIEVSQVTNNWADIDWENFDWEAFQNGGGENVDYSGYGNGEGGEFDYSNYGNGEGGEFDYGNYGTGEGGDGQNLAELMTVEQEDFKTKNATLIVDINGDTKSFKKVTFSLGGTSARTYGRQAFNLKIRGDKQLYGRSQFRIRSDARDATTLRSKLACDIHNSLDMISISANYITLYINDHYLGLYVIMDAVKVSWAKWAFGDENTTNLYQCKEALSYLDLENSVTGCINEDDDITDNTEFVEFLTALSKAESAEDIEDIFDIDQFLYEIAYEYLSGSWDHYLYNGHNYNVYKNIQNGKWTVILYDFDGDLGQDTHFIEIYPRITDSKDYPTYSFLEWDAVQHHLVDILIHKDPTRFNNILKTVVTKVFNPTVLFPHIDEIKEMIRPYIEEEKTPDENGEVIGVINKYGYDFPFEYWEPNIEFTSITDGVMSRAYGIKYWILMKYRYVCKNYDIECDPVYMDENYEYTIDERVAVNFEDFNNSYQPSNITNSIIVPNVPEPTTTVAIPEPTTTTASEPTSESESKSESESESESEPEPELEPTFIPEPTDYQCLAEVLGFSCCDKSNPLNRIVYHRDAFGDWGFDFFNKEWCGLTPYIKAEKEKCWSEDFGIPCCNGCKVYAIGRSGTWGYEHNTWCGIKPSCSKNPKPEPHHPEPGHPEPGHPEPHHPEPHHPEPHHPEPGHPKPGHPEPGHPEPGHPEPQPGPKPGPKPGPPGWK